MGFVLVAEMEFHSRFYGCNCRFEERKHVVVWHLVWFLQRLGPT
jgi:hypothetical protein